MITTIGNVATERDINDPVMASAIGTDFTISMLNTIVLLDDDSGVVILQFSGTIYVWRFGELYVIRTS